MVFLCWNSLRLVNACCIVDSIKQADSIFQVNEGITQISSVVQLNTATAEQSAASAEELSNQSSMLKKLIDKFRF